MFSRMLVEIVLQIPKESILRNNFNHIIRVLFVAVCMSFFSYAFGQSETDSVGFAQNKDKRLVYDVIDKLFSSTEAINNPITVQSGTIETEGIQVFGWHPSWLGDAYLNYDYSLLTTASYFSCTMLKNGYENIEYETNGWETADVSQMISMAKADGCNLILTLRCHEAHVIKHLLDEKYEQLYCIEYLTELITKMQIADGINVTFENIPLGYRSEFTSFLADFSTALKSLDKDLVLTLPAVPDKRIYDLPQLNEFVDQFVIMGYNYYYSGSAKPGPVAPLESGTVWGDLNLKNSLSSYLKKGINKKKLIMALPFYGAVWQLDSLVTGEVKSTFFEHRRLNKILIDLNGTVPKYDTIAYTAYYTYTRNNKDYICYFDDARTLKHKFDWIESQGIAGIGIWALGYDTGEKEVWRMLDDNFSIIKNPGFNRTTDSDTSVSSVASIESSEFSDIENQAVNILKQKEVIIVVGCILIGCVLIGVLLAFMTNSVYKKFLIKDWTVYLKVSGVFILFVLICIIVIKFVLIDDENIAKIIELNKTAPIIISSDIVSYLINIGLFGWIIITMLSWKVFLTLNKDIP